MKHHTLHGTGLALRPALLAPLKNRAPDNLQFLELTPPDWIGVSARICKDLQQLTQHYPCVCLSQSLSLGGPGALDKHVLRDLRSFIAEHGVQVFSEALAWSADDAPLFINLPIPSTRAAVAWTAARIAQVQDALGLRIGIRNVVHRMTPAHVDMNEAEFISAVVSASGCSLHLDLHALAANALHFGFDPHAFLQALPLSHIDYVRVGREYPLLGDVLARTHRRVARCVDDVMQLNLEALTC
ncbi:MULTISPECIES: DUF692 family multinuclear iron-containing protein [unclassified Limnohabitans]|jgi:hypothetical protein|uniref:DUF692 domain-containing protein n=1 Tax=unclassified Limnohabitans TaxID=2626134 RepID=UPI000CF2B871|nr:MULTISPECIES: DUF692 family multinuclear iron-containing protein [unclassified Limnohabitans]PQA85032.1 hypothetical protein C5F52_03295 [Limnohabitans sp. TS-CS-82]BDU54363.1 hypothetical protein LTEGF4_00440 [Limnohabitans sp. TEGF004]